MKNFKTPALLNSFAIGVLITASISLLRFNYNKSAIPVLLLLIIPNVLCIINSINE